MKFWVIAVMFALMSTLSYAEEVTTDCPWANQDNRNAGKSVKTSSSQSKSKGSKVRSQ